MAKHIVELSQSADLYSLPQARHDTEVRTVHGTAALKRDAPSGDGHARLCVCEPSSAFNAAAASHDQSGRRFRDSNEPETDNFSVKGQAARRIGCHFMADRSRAP